MSHVLRRRAEPALGALLVLAVLPACAANSPHVRARQEAMVSLGDSYISGEAGRWRGNSYDTSGSRQGTDRAWVCDRNGKCGRKPEVVYGTSYTNGCNRSDVAEIESAHRLGGLRYHPVNLACSGAETKDVYERNFKGEQPQLTRLEVPVTKYKVRLIVLSIGGNDMKFAGIIKSCYLGYKNPVKYPKCHVSQEANVSKRLESLPAQISTTVDRIHKKMKWHHYEKGEYRIVLQSYPTALAPSSLNRYPEKGTSRNTLGGCPFYDKDIDWARRVGTRISAVQQRVAKEEKIDFLDLSETFDGHEVCDRRSRPANADNTPARPLPAGEAEWMRYLVLFTQGQQQESVHPNAYGQQALGYCLGKLWALAEQQEPKPYKCVKQNETSREPSQVKVEAKS
ncbi:GDSL-type esterase/lipase family protein [Streptomyces sp. enrichment culture]|uniref:GDSL-type esterase/lipase family protein n=1 Tax=Streptomyces sp. enrichment culture TaxID=1795815 RepID=UPI003F559DAC